MRKGAASTRTGWLLKPFEDLNVWRRGEEREPHKPLLILCALGQLQAGEDRLIGFDSIAAATGIDLESTARADRGNGEFRATLVSAWDHRCAFGGYGVRLDNSDLGLEAHIRWRQYGGPDTADYGLAC